MDCEDFADNYNNQSKIIIGICAMAKKTNSLAMNEITERLKLFDELNVYIFEEETILERPVEKWPIVDCLISFHSEGFPLDKAIRYTELRNPFVINDLYMQYHIKDRRDVYNILAQQNICQPRYAILDRDLNEPFTIFDGDHLSINNTVFNKPFVEKPVSADDHNIYIYFPESAGGGSQRLFRKIGAKSSIYTKHSNIRKTGSYIYEDFMATDGTDVKVYTVGPDYAHAEARKSPALDGKVERDIEGKEVRYPVLLSADEKLIARKIVMAFKQNICGFDLLRANGISYVCDVNGLSFVKNSAKYYDDCAKILGNMVLRKLAPSVLQFPQIDFEEEDIPIVPTTAGGKMELRSVIGVIRHGDRTPKQKMKMEVKNRKFFTLFESYGGFKTGHLKLKKPHQLQEVLDITRYLLTEMEKNTIECGTAIEEKRYKLLQLKSVLEMHGYFSGINRKVQFKYQHVSIDNNTEKEIASCLVLILKWGGELTPAGKEQAEELGKAFRFMYPDYGAIPGFGLLRLHSTFRHDLKIYASEEGRVQMTAAAFAKGLLDLEGELTPILVQMVKSANMNGLLDNDNESTYYQNQMKETLQNVLNENREFTEGDYTALCTDNNISLKNAMQFIKNPVATCKKMHNYMINILEQFKQLAEKNVCKDQMSENSEQFKNTISSNNIKNQNSNNELYQGESWELVIRRWSKLVKDFKTKENKWDISKIPDIYDCIKYDIDHNYKFLLLGDSDKLYCLAKAFADIVIPQEYGITKEEKLQIGQYICSPLMRKILSDLQRQIDGDATRLDTRYTTGVSGLHHHVRTRLYFTSESHIHSLLTIFKNGGFCDVNTDVQWEKSINLISNISELNYMSQIIIMMYEDPSKEQQSEERFHVELHFSPGTYNRVRGDKYPTGFVNYVKPLMVNKDRKINNKVVNKLQDGDGKDSIKLFEKQEDTVHPLPIHGVSKKRTISSSSPPTFSIFDKWDSNVSLPSGAGLVVPSIQPLKTMHSSLTLKKMENFLTSMIISNNS